MQSKLFYVASAVPLGKGYFDILYTKEKIYVVVVINAAKAKKFSDEKAMVNADSQGKPVKTFDMGGVLESKSYDYNDQSQSISSRFEAMYRDFFTNDSDIKIYTAPTTVTAPTHFTLINNKK